MDINITGRNIELSDDIKGYIQKRLGKLERMYKGIQACDVVLEEEKMRQNVEIILYIKGSKIVAKESSTDVYASIDSAATSIKKQLRRISDRTSSRRRRVFNRFVRFWSQEEVFFPEEGEIIRTNMFADKPMLPEEAKMELNNTDKDFLVFKNADTGEVNVLYKRHDGNYGLVEPKF